MKRLFLVLSLLTLAACQPSDPDLTIITQDGKKYGFEVEMAMTEPQWQKGMMYRDSLDKYRGMFFWFGGAAEERGFWMKNVKIDLDIIFIDEDGKIISIREGKAGDPTTLPSDGPAVAAFEINGGYSKKWGIKPGDTVHFAYLGNALVE